MMLASLLSECGKSGLQSAVYIFPIYFLGKRDFCEMSDTPKEVTNFSRNRENAKNRIQLNRNAMGEYFPDLKKSSPFRKNGCPGRGRTYDQVINSHLLCH